MWTDNDNRTWKQCVSTSASTRFDVLDLQKALDDELFKRQAREQGICPVRQSLYAQCLDELIRQITVESAERGLLLMRVRDQISMSTSAYRTLYNTAILFGTKKQIEAEAGSEELNKRIEELENEKLKLQFACADQRTLFETQQKRADDARVAMEKRQNEEKEFLKYQAQHLEAFLKQSAQ